MIFTTPLLTHFIEISLIVKNKAKGKLYVPHIKQRTKKKLKQ